MSTQSSTIPHRGVEPSWLRPKEWRQATGMPHTTTQRLLRSGAIRAVRVGESWYIRRSEIEDFFERAAADSAA